MAAGLAHAFVDVRSHVALFQGISPRIRFALMLYAKFPQVVRAGSNDSEGIINGIFWAPNRLYHEFHPHYGYQVALY